MSKIHIALVGGQLMPVYLGVNYCEPDKVLFVYSKQTEKEKQRLKAEFTNTKKIRSEDFLKSEPLDPVNMEEIERTADSLRQKYLDDEVSLNISSGTKAWSYYFAKAFETHPNCKTFYIDQNNNIYELKSKTSEKLKTDMMIQFKLNKNPLKSYTDFASYTEEDFQLVEQIETFRKKNIGIFTSLTNLDRDKQEELKHHHFGEFDEQKSGSCLSWSKEDNTCKISIKKTNKGLTEQTFSSPNIFKILFNAAWFELKVAKILSEWEKAKHIYMNCKFLVNHYMDNRFGNDPAEWNIKNEVDIIVDTGEKALFIECKTNIKESTDIDKFKTVVESVGGNGSKALFICLNKIGDKEKEKLKSYNMLSFSFDESKDNIVSLYEMLDREISTINK